MDENPNCGPRRFGAQFFLVIVLILIAAGAGASAMYFLRVSKPREENINVDRKAQLAMTGSDLDGFPSKLDPKFSDADGNLVADPPKDPKDFIDPPKLVFCYVADDEPEKIRDQWKPFCDHLSQVTGKPVEYLLVKSIDEQIKALSTGDLQVTGLNTGAVPRAVNTCGFIPICRVPTADPSGTHVEIIVPASVPRS